MPITDRGVFLNKRKNVEDPFVINGRYIVFPEAEERKVQGFFVYDRKGAWHYDAVDVNGKTLLKDLAYDSARGILEMIAQPSGLETVTMTYLPGFDPKETDNDGPVMLGSSVLPVVGAMISRPAQRKNAYYNPTTAYESDLRRWMSNHSTGRQPATDKTQDVKKTIVRLIASERKDVWQPLDHELKLRREWIETHNLDEMAFREFSRVMESSCKP